MSPAYDFQCPSCQGVVEVTRSFSDDSAGPNCDKCAVEMTKVFTATPAIFRGSGWAKVPKL